MVDVNAKSRTEKGVLDQAATRARLEMMWSRAFDPESMGAHRLHAAETARFIADQARKLRLAALRAGLTGLVWMVESVYYEAYTVGCKRQGLEAEPSRRRG